MNQISKTKKAVLILLLVVSYCIIPMIFLGILHPNCGYITCVITAGVVLYTWYLLHRDESPMDVCNGILGNKKESVSDR